MTVIYLGGQPRTPCQQCGLFERDAHGKCYCTQLACPVGLLHRRMRQRTWPAGRADVDAAPRAAAVAQPIEVVEAAAPRAPNAPAPP